jgi:hypothetical protein
LQGLTFQPGAAMMTDLSPMSLADFMTTLPALAKAHERTDKPRLPRDKAALAEASAAHPWMEDYLSLPANPGDQAGQSAASRADDAQEDLDELPDDALARVWQELQDKREQWAVDAVCYGEDFTTIIRGGPWTAIHKGKAFDRCAATAKPGGPSQWCVQHAMNKQAHFSFNLYGEVVASSLAAEWCKRMQFFYNLWLGSGQAYTYGPEDKVAYKPGDAWHSFKANLPSASKASQRAVVIEGLFPSRRPNV